MAGWSREKRLAFEEAFYAYLDHCEINSKDHGEPIILGKYLEKIILSIAEKRKAWKHKKKFYSM
jgi:hypothetical protein